MSTKKKKTFQYSQKLQKSLEKLGEACNEIATLALQYDLHSTHVNQVTEFSKNRVAELKKQVEQKRPSSVVELLDIDETDMKESTKTEKEVPVTSEKSKETPVTSEKPKETPANSDSNQASSGFSKPSSTSPGNNHYNKPEDKKSSF